MKIALVSLNQKWEDKIANRIQCAEYVDLAMDSKCDLVIFPEMTLTGFSMNVESCSEDYKYSETLVFFQNLSIKYQISIIFGMIMSIDNTYENRLIVLNKNGEVIADYAKIHPFSYSGEDKIFRAGENLGFANINQIDFGLSICYDLRFPELYQILSQKATVIVNIANWPAKRLDHWKTLIKARAIENQVYMIAVNRTGTDGNGLLYEESSMVFDPEGNCLNPESTIKDLSVYTIDADFTEFIRAGFPMKNDRKVNFYINNLKNA